MYAKAPQSFKKLSAANLPEKTIISAQFVKIVDRLITDGKVNSYTDLLEKYGYARSAISHIKNGVQDVSIDLLYNVVMDYKIDPLFVFGVEANIYGKQSSL